MINICDVLYEICEDKSVYDPDCELIESGLLDSYAFIELLSALEDHGIVIQPTRVDRDMFKTPDSIQKMIDEYKK